MLKTRSIGALICTLSVGCGDAASAPPKDDRAAAGETNDDQDNTVGKGGESGNGQQMNMTGGGAGEDSGQGGSANQNPRPTGVCPDGPFEAPLASATVTANKVEAITLGPMDYDFHLFEGPVWVDGSLYFSDIKQDVARINRFTPPSAFEVGFIDESGSNGLATDGSGTLFAATHDVGAISTFDAATGIRSPFGPQMYDGKRFTAPNDLTVRSDGNVYFTDPNSGQAQGVQQDKTRVYRISPAGDVSVVDDALQNPNGISLSPDESKLYVNANGAVRQYDVDADGVATAGSDLVTGLEVADGMAVDCAGNLYITEHQKRHILVVTPDGTELGTITGMDENVTNAAFGGADRKTLFITTSRTQQAGGVFSVDLGVPGLPY